MLSHSIQLLSRMDPMKYLFEKPALSGKLARWQLLLSEFDIIYITQKSIKGRAIADHLAAHPLPSNGIEEMEFPDEDILNIEESSDIPWKIYFDGAHNKAG